MKILDLISAFIRDLLEPRRVESVLPPAPVETQEIIRATLTRAMVAQIISGSDSTLLDKATFAVAPVIVDAVAQWGADQGARDRAIDGRRQGSGTVIITARSELE
jgi:hypothetical protein